MWTEVEKYIIIQDYLKGKLSGLELLDFESKWSSDVQFREEVEQHRLANDAILDLYLLEVKSTTKKVLKKKAQERNWRNWGLGLSVFLGIGILFSVLRFSKPSQKDANAISSNELTSIEKKVEPEFKVKATKSAASNGREKAQSQNIISPALTLLKEEGMEKPMLNDQIPPNRNIATNEAVQFTGKEYNSEMENKGAPKAEQMLEIANTENLTPKEMSKFPDNGNELIFNPQLGEQVNLPLEEDFNGEFQVFNSSGSSVYKCSIQNGYPNSWDGKAHSGGIVTGGQYGFSLKSTNGQEKMGYITVAK